MQTRWNDGSVMFNSILENITTLTNVFVQQLNARPVERLVNIENDNYNEQLAHVTVLIHDYWDTLKQLSPIVCLFLIS